MGRYVALLRGINVGGKNPIKMVALKACFEELGLRDVATYIQSGNVLFTAKEEPKLAARIEAAIDATFGCHASVALLTQKQMSDVVAKAPKGFGKAPEKFRYDVLFLLPPLKPTAALKELPLKDGVDEVSAGPGVLYFSRLISKATQSRLMKVASLPIYKSMTIRNWNTTTALQRMSAGA